MKSDHQQGQKTPDRTWVSNMILALLVAGAAAGVLSGISPAIMIAAAALALIGWEIFGQIGNRRGESNHASLRLAQWAHFRLLVTSVGIGLLLAEVGLLIQIPVPFGIILLAGILVVFGFYKFARLVIS